MDKVIPNGNKNAFEAMIRVMVPPAGVQEAEETSGEDIS